MVSVRREGVGLGNHAQRRFARRQPHPAMKTPTAHILLKIPRSPSLFRLLGIFGLLLLAFAGQSRADTNYLYYSGTPYYSTDMYYRYDTLTGEVDYDAELNDDWTFVTSSGDPSELGMLIVGENWEYSGYAGYDFATDAVTGVWYLYIGDSTDPTWFPYSNPNVHDFTYCVTDDFYERDDSLGGFWTIDSGNYIYNHSLSYNYDAAYDYSDYGAPVTTVYIIGGENWAYSMVGDYNYAYDSVIDTWYIDTGTQDPWFGNEVWEVTTDPN